jgi:hypothetical protein
MRAKSYQIRSCPKWTWVSATGSEINDLARDGVKTDYYFEKIRDGFNKLA